MNQRPDASREQVIEHNLRLHERTARSYDRIHYYLHNRVEQVWLWRDLRYVHRYLQQTQLGPIHYLDLGCGTGNVALKLLRLGGHVTGVDLSATMLQLLQKKAAAAGSADRLRTFRASADELERLPVESREAVHAVCISSLLHHLYDYMKPFRGLSQLCPAVRIVYFTHEPAARTSLLPPGAIRRASNRLLRGLDLFLTEKLRGPNDEIPDDPVADYHFFRNGVEASTVAAVLSAQGISVRLIHRRYNMRRTSLASALDNIVLRPLRNDIFPITMFTLAVARPAP